MYDHDIHTLRDILDIHDDGLTYAPGSDDSDLDDDENDDPFPVNNSDLGPAGVT